MSVEKVLVPKNYKTLPQHKAKDKLEHENNLFSEMIKPVTHIALKKMHKDKKRV